MKDLKKCPICGSTVLTFLCRHMDGKNEGKYYWSTICEGIKHCGELKTRELTHKEKDFWK